MVHNISQYLGTVRRQSGSETGQALIETALVIPILMLLLLAAAEIARVADAAIEVANAAKAAVAYGAQSQANASDTTGIQTAAATDASDLTSTLTVTPTLSGICSSGNACTGANSTCLNTDCSTPGDHIENILTVNTSASINPLVHVTGLPLTYTVQGQAVQKVLH